METSIPVAAAERFKEIAQELTNRGFPIIWENALTFQTTWPVAGPPGNCLGLRAYYSSALVKFLIRFPIQPNGKTQAFNLCELVHLWHEVSCHSLLYCRDGNLVLQAAYYREYHPQRFGLFLALLENDLRRLLQHKQLAAFASWQLVDPALFPQATVLTFTSGKRA